MKNPTKYLQILTLAAAASVALVSAGCAVVREQETVGAYVDDSAITASVKSKFIADKTVDAAAISVETLKGTVALSGFAKSIQEKVNAGTIAKGVAGVKDVRNDVVVRP